MRNMIYAFVNQCERISSTSLRMSEGCGYDMDSQIVCSLTHVPRLCFIVPFFTETHDRACKCAKRVIFIKWAHKVFSPALVQNGKMIPTKYFAHVVFVTEDFSVLPELKCFKCECTPRHVLDSRWSRPARKQLRVSAKQLKRPVSSKPALSVTPCCFPASYFFTSWHSSSF